VVSYFERREVYKFNVSSSWTIFI